MQPQRDVPGTVYQDLVQKKCAATNFLADFNSGGGTHLQNHTVSHTASLKKYFIKRENTNFPHIHYSNICQFFNCINSTVTYEITKYYCQKSTIFFWVLMRCSLVMSTDTSSSTSAVEDEAK
jgi:hypothetical protein